MVSRIEVLDNGGTTSCDGVAGSFSVDCYYTIRDFPDLLICTFLPLDDDLGEEDFVFGSEPNIITLLPSSIP